MKKLLLIFSILTLVVACAPAAPEKITLRLQVALTPEELASFEPALATVRGNHPNWDIQLEAVPQGAFNEKITTQLAANDLPDVLRVPGLAVQQWIRQGAFLNLTPLIAESELPLDDFYPGPLAQFQWKDSFWGLPDTAAPDVVYYNKAMFDAAGLAYPTDDWTFEEMRTAALQLTRDSQNRTPLDPNFDPTDIQQWGWNGSLTFFWQRHLVQPFGADFCANSDCTLMNFTAPATVQAVQWWAALSAKDHAALYDPYGGSQTGIPGDPFISGKAAMGFNGFFAVGQLNAAGQIDYDIVQPFLGKDGSRYTPLSTNGYVIAANSPHPQEAWQLIQELLAPQFLAATWGQPAHAVPARRSVAVSVLNPARAPKNQQAILNAMEYGQVFMPYTASAFEVYAKTADLFQQMMKGDLAPESALPQIEQLANDTLARDRDGDE
ncbi:MAG: sugar ABC transporter substrate-binding protein [Anaerolineales bacterium]